MSPKAFVASLLASCLLIACDPGPRSRSEHPFDDLARRVSDLNAAEVTAILGEPDSRQRIFLKDERWIWWNYTYLDGENYPPEVRGQVVHLEITFRNPAEDNAVSPSASAWRIAEPFGVAYRIPGATLLTNGRGATSSRGL